MKTPEDHNSGARPASRLAESAYATIRTMVLHRELPGGTLVVEIRMADQLGISRTPMREALARLVGEGLLVRDGAGTFTVRRVTAAEFFQTMRVRELLEVEAIRLAIGRVGPERIERIRRRIASIAGSARQEATHWTVDDELHLMFAEASGNKVLEKLIRNARITTRLFEIVSPFQRVKEDAAEHLDLLDAFSRNGRRATCEAMLRHLRNLEAHVAAALTGGPPMEPRVSARGNRRRRYAPGRGTRLSPT